MKNKQIEKLNGRLQSSNFSLSIDKRMSFPIIDIFGGGTNALRKVFMMKLGVKDEWELENAMTKMVFEKAEISKRDNLTRIVEEMLIDYMINFYKERFKELNNQQKDYLKDLEQLKKEIKEKSKEG